MEDRIAIVSFTDEGAHTAERIRSLLGGVHTCSCGEADFSLAAWTKEAFSKATALIFVGAAGIAVRAAAPLLRSKATDPAVLCVDETGRFVIPLLSGHLGGANALAARLAEQLGATAVITTATDLRHVFAVDLWAAKQGLVVLQPDRIKTVSAKLLRGESIRIMCPWPISGRKPEGIELAEKGDVTVSCRPQGGEALQLVPRRLYLGIGCRRGAGETQIEAAFQRFCAEREILPQAICAAASIELKEDEAGLLGFCRAHDWPLSFFSASRLAAAEGMFTASAFVKDTIGVDNVCERSAVLASGGKLREKKYARDGVTFAAALQEPELDWSW